MMGIDDAEMGEFAYDYVALDSELGFAQHPHGTHEVPNEANGEHANERRGGHAGPRDVHHHAHEVEAVSASESAEKVPL